MKEPTSNLWPTRLRGEGEINVSMDKERRRSPFEPRANGSLEKKGLCPGTMKNAESMSKD